MFIENDGQQLSPRIDYIDVYGVGVLGEWLNVITATNGEEKEFFSLFFL